jgi:hypothetical protein
MLFDGPVAERSDGRVYATFRDSSGKEGGVAVAVAVGCDKGAPHHSMGWCCGTLQSVQQSPSLTWLTRSAAEICDMLA